ncbi:hypothetical protein J5224_27540, partial [Candidatus Symbiopectobacterium sp. NZEC135]|nr:hypothetical protein [Candidatus Symbiopectobacterium sp. NZEC135]
SAQGVEVSGIYGGRYQARVRAINATEISSLWANAQETMLTGKAGNPPALSSFTTTALVFGVQLDWQFPADTDDTLKTEIQYSLTSDGQNVLLLTDVAYPTRAYQQMGLSVGQAFFYRARIVDKSGNQGPWTGWVVGESSTDVGDIADAILEEVEGSDAWQSLVTNIATNTQQIADGMLSSIEQAKAILRNSLTIDEESRRWRSENGARVAEIADTRAAVANEVEARTIALLEMQAQIGSTQSNLNSLQQTVTTLEKTTAQNVDSLSSKMRAAEGEIDGLSTAVGGLQTTVTQQGNTLTSQGQSITQITASVGTAQTAADSAKSSAAAAQQAATNAAAAAGNKGKVIYGTAEPAVADRLTQNVWIDTTNSINTPKRWTGSAWQAVTDKAATDAAAAAKSAASAAAAAQSTANGAVQSVNAVSATVTQQGNTITAQGTQISQLTATVNGATTKISDISQAVNGIDGKL